MNNQAFKDGQTFYIPAPGCDEKIRWQMLEADIKNAFAPEEYLREVYRKFSVESISAVIEYYRDYKRGILDKMKNWPKIVSPKAKKILDKYWRE